MDALEQLTERLQQLKGTVIIDVLQESFNELKFDIAQANRAQLREGERADGTKLPNYSRVSVAKFGKPAGPMKLHDTGSFYAGINVKVSEEGIDIVDIDSKTAELQERYGENILGLSQENWDEIRVNKLIPMLGEKVIKRIGI